MIWKNKLYQVVLSYLIPAILKMAAILKFNGGCS